LKKILFHGNWTKLNTGFGGVKKRVMRWFFNRGWTVVEAINGMEWDAPETKQLPWKAYGLNPTREQLGQIQSIQDAGQRDAAMRAASYGLCRIDDVVKLEKPDIILTLEDSWGFGDMFNKEWAKKIQPYYWCTIDSEPLLDSQVELGLKADNLLVWATFAEKLYQEKGYGHVKTMPGCIDPDEFKPITKARRNELRQKFGLQDSFVTMFLGRNQLRKQFPNLLDGFKLFTQKYPSVNAKLLFHCSWAEGWPLQQLIKEKEIDPASVLTTYYCKSCRGYEIRPFVGQPLDCPICKAKGTFETTNIVHGVSESDLSDIYGISDLVTNPISSGGFELSSFQAKMCGKILSTTAYSCGLDACSEESAGIPLQWEAYTEPNTAFTKSTTLPSSICESMEKVYFMPAVEREAWENKARNFAVNYCSTEAVCLRLEKLFLNHPPVELTEDDFKTKPKNPSYVPPDNLSPENFVISILSGMFNDKVDCNSKPVQEWAAHLHKTGDFVGVYKHFQNLAHQANAQLNNKSIDLGDLLDKDDDGKRICIVAEQSAGDLIIINSLLNQFKNLYPEYNLYFFTRPEFFPLLESHPAIHKLLQYSPVLENIFFLEGNGEHKGYFEAAFYPLSQTQKHLSYQHNNLKYRAEWL
jgi:glycosyltransferase involved in cell wall biosynthesis